MEKRALVEISRKKPNLRKRARVLTCESTGAATA